MIKTEGTAISLHACDAKRGTDREDDARPSGCPTPTSSSSAGRGKESRSAVFPRVLARRSLVLTQVLLAPGNRFLHQSPVPASSNMLRSHPGACACPCRCGVLRQWDTAPRTLPRTLPTRTNSRPSATSW
eukprot:2296024-Rhodomonas_salina.2